MGCGGSESVWACSHGMVAPFQGPQTLTLNFTLTLNRRLSLNLTLSVPYPFPNPSVGRSLSYFLKHVDSSSLTASIYFRHLEA